MVKVVLFCFFGCFVVSVCRADCVDNLKASPPVAHLHKNLNSYVEGMEKSTLQKAAFQALASTGVVVDLGCGSGRSSFELALLSPDSKVIGVDLDEKMIAYAREHYKLPNLSFMVGDAEKMNFLPNSVDAFLMSSTGHHLTSYKSVDRFDPRYAQDIFPLVRRQLKSEEIFVFRDFLISEGPPAIEVDLPLADGTSVGTYQELSTAAFFEIFAKDFRNRVHPTSGVRYQRIGEVIPGKMRYRVSHRDATEFLLRKDYREDYEAEIKEEYTYMRQDGFHRLASMGYRILVSVPIWNPWIEQHRFEDKIQTWSLDGNRLPFPATNYVLAVQKVDPGVGAQITMVKTEVVKPKFLKVQSMTDRSTDEIWDLVYRDPTTAVDVIPTSVRNGRRYVWVRQGYPRPIPQSVPYVEHLNRAMTAGYTIEPISFLRNGGKPLFSDIEEQLTRRVGLTVSDLAGFAPTPDLEFYPSPGTVTEQIRSVSIPIKDRPLNTIYPPENYSGLSTSGVVRPFEATQLLRTLQVGSVLDARLELATYNLLLDHRESVGPWIGDEIEIAEVASVRTRRLLSLLNSKQRSRQFEPAPPETFGKFLEVRKGTFVETDFQGTQVAETEREYVIPKNFSTSTVSVIPVLKKNGKIFVGVEDRNLPGVQLSEGFSNILTNFAWRMPKQIKNLYEAREFVKNEIATQLNTTVSRIRNLGGAYYPSSGLTPEVVYPMVAFVSEQVSSTKISWVSLEDLVKNRRSIKDGQLLISSLRLAHATGLLR